MFRCRLLVDPINFALVSKSKEVRFLIDSVIQKRTKLFNCKRIIWNKNSRIWGFLSLKVLWIKAILDAFLCLFEYIPADIILEWISHFTPSPFSHRMRNADQFFLIAFGCYAIHLSNFILAAVILTFCCLPCWAIYIIIEPILLATNQPPLVAK